MFAIVHQRLRKERVVLLAREIPKAHEVLQPLDIAAFESLTISM